MVSEIIAYFDGPRGCCYAKGTWAVKVVLSPSYPFKAPKCNFVNPPYHPNVDAATGEICMAELQEDWKPSYDLGKVFKDFLPRLLTYPSLVNPLNPMAASELQRDMENFHMAAEDHSLTMALVLATEEAEADKKAAAKEAAAKAT